MTFRARLVVAGIATFVLGLIVLFPARVAYEIADPAGVAVSGIEGSVWRGSARESSVSGVYVSDLRWRFRPLLLFTGKIGYVVEADPPGGFAEARIAIGFGGTVQLDDVTASLPVAMLATPFNTPGMSGMANAQFERIRLVDGVPIAVDGSLEVANLYHPQIFRAPIGGFRADFFTQDTGIMASVEDTDAVFELAGRFQLGLDRSYEFVGQVAPNAETPDLMRQRMQMLGSADERGQREIRLMGRL